MATTATAVPAVADLEGLSLQDLRTLAMGVCKQKGAKSSWVQHTNKADLIDWLARASGQKLPPRSATIADVSTVTPKLDEAVSGGDDRNAALVEAFKELIKNVGKADTRHVVTIEEVEAMFDRRIEQIKGMDEATVRAIVDKSLEGFIRPVTLTVAGVTKVLEGVSHERFATLLKFVNAGVNVWVAGPAGSGKTTGAEFGAKALGMPFEFNGAIDSEHKLLGFIDANGRIISRPFRKAFEFGGVYLFDEVDASMPAALLAFNAALANGYADFPDGKVNKHPNFRAIAAGNTWNGQSSLYCGRVKMDAAFLDRFAYLEWPIDERLECAMVGQPYKGKQAVFRDDPVDADELPGVIKRWPQRVQAHRAALVAAGSLQHIISPRATLFGIKLLAAGVSLDIVEKATLQKGLSDTQWAPIARAAAGMGGSR